MEGEEIGLVLARASELRSKVNTSIAERVRMKGVGGVEEEEEEGEEEDEVVEESLLSIRDALASLEQQLSSLQDLQQQQLYERESSLTQIDRGRMILLSKLKEYKGEDLEVIRDAAAFAGETITKEDDLLLPPYPRHLPDTLILDDLFTSNFVSKYKLCQNGRNNDFPNERKSKNNSLKKKQVEHTRRNWWSGFKPIIWFATKSAFTILSLMSVMSMTGIDQKLLKKGNTFRLLNSFQKSFEKKHNQVQCPTGKILVIEGGKSRCVVKERIEVPFDSDVKAPNVSYGLG